MNPSKIVFIVNPNASGGSTGREWPFLEAKARDRLGDFRTSVTTSPGCATRLAREAIAQGVDTLVCVGGDGTFNEVVNGLMSEAGPLSSNVLIGLIPRGTGCDFSRSIPIPKDTDRALENIANSRFKRIDMGKLVCRDFMGQVICRYFHNIASFGLGGEVDQEVNRTRKALGGFGSFLWGTLTSLLRYRKKHIRLRVDEHFHNEITCWNVVVANGQYHGGGMWVAPEAVLDDGLFHVTIIGDLTLAEVFWNLPKLYNGRIYQVQKTLHLTGRHIEATSCDPVLIDMDGEQPGRLPITIDILPSALSLICG